MANPNLLSATSCYADSRAGAFSGLVTLYANPSSSGKVVKIISLYICNYSSTVTNFIKLYSQSGTGTAYYFIDNLELPPKTTVIVATKDNPIILREYEALVLIPDIPDSQTYAMAYEEYS
jgi:hypothetical protein